MGKEEIPEVIKPSLINKEFSDLVGKKPIEYTLGDQVADQHLRIRHGQFNIILGHPSVGKTTWIVWYLFQLAEKHGLKTMIYSGENDATEIFSQLVQCFTGKEYWNVSEEEVGLASDFIHDHFYFISDLEIYTAEQLFESFEEPVLDVDVCVIDPHNSVKVPEGQNWYQYSVELGMKIRAFCKRTKKTVFLCAHPNSEAQRRVHSKGDFEGMICPPIGPNMEGGSTWKNKCDNLWIIHRYTNHSTKWKQSQVIVEKIRYQNTGAKPTMLEFPLIFSREPDGNFTIGIDNKELTYEEKRTF